VLYYDGPGTISYVGGDALEIVSAEGTDTVTGIERVWFGNDSVDATAYLPAPLAAVDDDNAGDSVIEAPTVISEANTANGNVLANDTPSLSLTVMKAGAGVDLGATVGTETEIAGTYGKLTISSDGSWTYRLDDTLTATNALAAAATAEDVFSYEVSDGTGTDSAQLTIAVSGSNDAPSTADRTIMIAEDGSYGFSAADFGFVDPDAGDALQSVRITSLPAGGSLTMNGVAVTAGQSIAASVLQQLVYRPAANANGSPLASFGFRVSDGALESAAKAIMINVNAVNDAPSLGGIEPSGVLTVVENTLGSIDVSATDVDGPGLSFSLEGDDAELFVLDGHILRFAAAPDFEAPLDRDGDNIYNVAVAVSDGSLTDKQTLMISVSDALGNTVVGTKKADAIDPGNKIGLLGATDEADLIKGRGGKDTIDGAGGDDTLQGGAKADVLDGGAGFDIADYSDKTTSVMLTLNGAHQVRARVGGVSEDKVSNIEGAIGGRAGDKLTGDGGANLLNGGGGNDLLSGRKGDDTLTGGKGDDRFVFDTKPKAGQVDVITDFKHGHDMIALDDRIVRAIGAALDEGEFYAKKHATEAHDADDRLIYDKKTGNLYYDADGNADGGKDAILFATLVNEPALDTGDFVIV
jgi:VCBS repeat-containing protein